MHTSTHSNYHYKIFNILYNIQKNFNYIQGVKWVKRFIEWINKKNYLKNDLIIFLHGKKLSTWTVCN